MTLSGQERVDAADGVLVAVSQDVTDAATAKQSLEYAEAAAARRAEQLGALVDLAEHAIGGTFKSILERSAALIKSVLRVPFAVVLAMDPDGKHLREIAGHDGGPPIVVSTARDRDTVEIATLTASKPVFWSRGETSQDCPTGRARGARCGVFVSVLGDQADFLVVGALGSTQEAFGADDGRFLDGVAHLLGSAATRAAGEARRTLLLERLTTAYDDERRHLARELHDTAGSALAAILMTVHRLEQAADLDVCRRDAKILHEQIATTLNELLRHSRGLHPATLDELGLGPALEAELASVARHHGIMLLLDVQVDRFPSKYELALFRIAQEAMTNVVRHAHATMVTVTLWQDHEAIWLTLADNGVGFPGTPPARGSGIGLAGMRERAALAGGSLTTRSETGCGTTIEVRLPRTSSIPVPGSGHGRP